MTLARAVTIAVLGARALGAQAPDTVVRIATKPVHAGVATLQRDIGIGVADGDENYMIGAIADIAVGPTGNIYIWDFSVPAIRMYDAAGKFVKNIGRKGRGPGEYQSGAAIAVAKDGRLLQYDPGNARVNVYSATGEVLAAWPTRAGGSGSASGRGLLTVDTAGTSYVVTTFYNRKPGVPVQPRRGWLRFNPDGELRDTVYVPASTEAVVHAQSGNFSSSAVVPFSPVEYSIMSPLGYLVSGRSHRIAIDLHESEKSVASIRRDVTLQPVTGKERDSARADITAKMERTAPGWSWNGPDIPKMKAAYQGLLVANDGRLWVQLDKGPRRKEADGTTAPTVSMGGGRSGGPGKAPGWSCPTSGWSLNDVYEPSGKYIGQVRIPEGVEPTVMRGDYVWATTCSEDEVPMVVRYRIVWR